MVGWRDRCADYPAVALLMTGMAVAMETGCLPVISKHIQAHRARRLPGSGVGSLALLEFKTMKHWRKVARDGIELTTMPSHQSGPDVWEALVK